MIFHGIVAYRGNMVGYFMVIQWVPINQHYDSDLPK